MSLLNAALAGEDVRSVIEHTTLSSTGTTKEFLQPIEDSPNQIAPVTSSVSMATHKTT